MKIAWTLLGGWMLFSTQFAYASSCHERTESNAELTDCLRREYRSADRELNRVYQRIMRSIRSKEEKRELRQAQREWIRYKTRDCRAAASQYGGGSGGPAAEYECLGDRTRTRTQELRGRYSTSWPFLKELRGVTVLADRLGEESRTVQIPIESFQLAQLHEHGHGDRHEYYERGDHCCTPHGHDCPLRVDAHDPRSRRTSGRIGNPCTCIVKDSDDHDHHEKGVVCRGH